jgi:hypothetical protein
MFFTDVLPPELERERRELIEKRARLRAMIIGDPADGELRQEIERIEAALKQLDTTGSTSSA